MFNKGSKYTHGSKTELKFNEDFFSNKNIWLVKATNLNRGRGIYIFNDLSDLEFLVKDISRSYINNNYNSSRSPLRSRSPILRTIEPINNNINNINNISTLNLNKSVDLETINKQNQSENPTQIDQLYLNKLSLTSNIVIQKYLEKPFLYNGRKFDIRIWVLLTNNLSVYYFKEGHLKACSVKYDCESLDNFTHFTNYSVQKKCKEFSKHEIGNEISFKTFQSYLNGLGTNKTIKDDIMPQIKEIIMLTMKSVKYKINISGKKYCYEVFGYDFILDSNLKVYLLEINTNPGLEESSPLIKQLVPRMIEDSLELTFNELYGYKPIENKTKVEGYDSNTNMFEFLVKL